MQFTSTPDQWLHLSHPMALINTISIMYLTSFHYALVHFSIRQSCNSVVHHCSCLIVVIALIREKAKYRKTSNCSFVGTYLCETFSLKVQLLWFVVRNHTDVRKTTETRQSKSKSGLRARSHWTTTTTTK